jgi:transposase
MVDVELSGGLGAVSRRRRRRAEERRRVVEETLVAGSSVARVAQRHGVNANQVFQWRRLYQNGLLGGTPTNALKLLPVSVTEDVAPAKPEQVEAAGALPVAATGAIHIELRKGIRISLEGAVDPALVRAVLKSLRS